MEKIVLVGGGGHAKTIVDTLERIGTYEIAGFVIPSEIGETVYRGYKVIGHDEDMGKIYASGIWNAFIAIGIMGKSDLRNRIDKRLKETGFQLPVVIDPSAIVASDAKIGEGTYIGRCVVINADAQIGRNCIINTGTIIEHECTVGDFVHIAVGAVLCGQAEVGENTFIGANATIIQGKHIGARTIIGAGAGVVADIPSDCTAVGVPARIIKTRK